MWATPPTRPNGSRMSSPTSTPAVGTASSWTTPTPTWAGTSPAGRWPSTRPPPPGAPRPARCWRPLGPLSPRPACSRSRTSLRRGPRTTTRRRPGRTGSSSPPAPRRSTTPSEAHELGLVLQQRLALPPAVPGNHRAGGQDLPRHHLRAQGRHALGDLGPCELPALRPAVEPRGADVRGERPRGARSVHGELDG